MKKIILLATAFVSLSAFSQTVEKEFDIQLEIQCHSELKALGCLNDEGEENYACAEAGKAKLSKDCAEMHDEKKSN